MALSIALLVYHAAEAPVRRLGQLVDGGFVDLRANPCATTEPGVLVLRPNAELFFANAETTVEHVLDAVSGSDPPPRVVVLDLEATDDLDVPACDSLRRLAAQLSSAGVQVALARVHEEARSALERCGVVDAVGAEHLFTRVEDAVASERSSLGTPAKGARGMAGRPRNQVGGA